MAVFTDANMVLVFANVIFFIIVQTLFFNFVASKQFNVVLRDKANIMQVYIDNNRDAKSKYHNFSESKRASEIRTLSKKQAKKRENVNQDTMLNWIGMPLLLATVIFLFFVLRIYYKDDSNWDDTDWVLLSLIVGAYVTELLFYLGIVRQYEFYGDQQIYSEIYSEINSRVNKEPLTSEGKRYKKYLGLIVNVVYQKDGTMDDIRARYQKYKNKIPELSEDIVMMYADIKMNSLTDHINFDTLDRMKGFDPDKMLVLEKVTKSKK